MVSNNEDPLPTPTLYPVPDTPVYKRYTPSPRPGPPPTDHEVAIVIDSGSWQLRAGFSTDTSPRFTCTPQVARYRDRKALKTYTICGDDTLADATSRSQAKSPFDGNVVGNFDVFENLLDYTFLKLGLEGDGSGGVGHPIVMTEAVCNPNYSRRVVTEMLFEAYQAPSVVYGIDSLFSYSYNSGTTGLVISSSHTSTHLIPVYNGRGILPLATRLNWGSTQSTEYLLKLLQLKYPTFPTKLAPWQAETLMVDHCYVSEDYRAEVSTYLDPKVLLDKDRVIQFPFIEQVAQVKSEEELAKIAERKKESGRRLQEQAARMRLEKLVIKEQQLDSMRTLQSRIQDGEFLSNKRDLKRMLDSHGVKDEAALEKSIRELDKSVKRARKEDVGEDVEDIPTFPLLDVPDEVLDPDQLKQKKTQRLMKSNWEARQRTKAEKEAEKARIAEEERRDAEMRENDLDAWISDKRAQREALLGKLEGRKKLKSELADRKSLAAQIRMKSLANLASDLPGGGGGASGVGGPLGLGGAAGGSRRRTNNPDADDNFGANDEDWAVYRTLGGPSGPGADDDEEDEEKLLTEQIRSLETQLHKHDPGFEQHLTALAHGDWKNSRLHHFLRGPWAPPLSAIMESKEFLERQAEHFQIHLNVERIRVPEVVFQPQMGGVDQAGVIEIASDLLLGPRTRGVLGEAAGKELQRDVFLTGGWTGLDGWEGRVRRELGCVVEWGSEIAVRKAKDPVWDAWRGAAGWVRGELQFGEEEYRRKRVTRAQYNEMGGEYIKEHRLGNATG
ncbi:hypothetical protein BGX38DRAFT_1268413 [Terfezia claveryi]|nr:hypothetical protein BGX38DRAFT_1268413 [Terfezia claveryi]